MSLKSARKSVPKVTPVKSVPDLQLLVVGDLHIKASTWEQINCVETQILQLIEKFPDLAGIVFLGDVLDHHNKIDLSCLNRAQKFFSNIRRMLPVSALLIILVGNHDRPNNLCFLTDEHPWGALLDWGGTTIVVDRPINLVVRGVNILGVPYVFPGRFFEAIGDFNLSSADLVFAHQEFRGAPLGIIPSVKGDVWPEEAPLCVSGHIHDRYVVQQNLVYPGTPYNSGWVSVERGGKKGVGGENLKPFSTKKGVDLYSWKFAEKRWHSQFFEIVTPINWSCSVESPELLLKSTAKNNFSDFLLGIPEPNKLRIFVNCLNPTEFAQWIKSNAPLQSLCAKQRFPVTILPTFPTTEKKSSNSAVSEIVPSTIKSFSSILQTLVETEKSEMEFAQWKSVCDVLEETIPEFRMTENPPLK